MDRHNIAVRSHCNQRTSCNSIMKRPIPLYALLLQASLTVQNASSFSPLARLGKVGLKVIGENVEAEAHAESKAIATDALEQLLERQLTEVQETERMIEAAKLQMIASPEAKGLAKSVLSGFDYGFVSRSEGVPLKDYSERDEITAGKSIDAALQYGPPGSGLSVSIEQFLRNLAAMRGEYRDEEPKTLTAAQRKHRKTLETLTLDSDAIWEKEKADGPIEAPFLVKIPYLVLCWTLDTMFEGKYVPARFFLLETVARMPYFSYITCLHLYETLDLWRRSADLKRVHMAQEDNEYHHLMIMESLGGDQMWWVRFLAQHAAIAYYIGLCMLWWVSPTLNYQFSELLEGHAVNTYGQFLEENEDILKQLPPSLAAIDYYALGHSDPFLEEYQTTARANGEAFRRPGYDMTTLFDVFTAIKADEGDHVGTMKACKDPSVSKDSASLEKRALAGVALMAAVGYLAITGIEIGTEMDAAVADQVLLGEVESTESLAGTIGPGLASLIPNLAAIRGMLAEATPQVVEFLESII